MSDRHHVLTAKGRKGTGPATKKQRRRIEARRAAEAVVDMAAFQAKREGGERPTAHPTPQDAA